MFNSRTMHHRGLAAVVAFGLLAVGCDTAKTSSKAKTNSTTTTSSTTAPGDIMKDAQAAVDLAYAGSFGTPPKTGPKAVPNKKLSIIRAAMRSKAVPLPGISQNKLRKNSDGRSRMPKVSCRQCDRRTHSFRDCR